MQPLYRPSWLAHHWGCTPEYLHRLCKEFDLVRLRVNPEMRLKARYRFPQQTVDRLAELLNREPVQGGEAALVEQVRVAITDKPTEAA